MSDVGATCETGWNDAWRHFVPARILIGQRTIEWATILGTNVNHTVIDKSEKYEIFYNGAKGAIQPTESPPGTNPYDYTWEYVPKCKDELREGCRLKQVPAFYLRRCPRGTQMINSSGGVLGSFFAAAQYCYPCGPLNYIVDPHSGGSCQECPKGASCPDGDQVIGAVCTRAREGRCRVRTTSVKVPYDASQNDCPVLLG